jgi:Fe2+ or Zn2+ uptake regulation protein
VVAEIEQRLRDAGLRATVPRVAVLRALTNSDDHPRVDQLIERVRGDGVSISTQAAYDVCEALHDNALARRVEWPGGPVRFDARVGDNHHHLVCRSCGVVDDTDCATGAASCLEPSQQHGFEIEAAEVTFWGLCPSCQREAKETI